MRLSTANAELRAKFGEKRALEMIKEAGFDAVDYTFHGYFDAMGDDYKEYAAEVRAFLDKIGLPCNQAHAPFDIKYGEKFDISTYNYLIVVRSIEAAAILGADSIIVHGIPVPEGQGIDAVEYNIKYYKSLQPVAEKAGIKIAVENLFTYTEFNRYHKGFLCTTRELCGIVKALASPTFIACFDLGHAAITGTTPEDFLNDAEKGIIKAVHIHDNDRVGDKHMLPYTGEMNWEAIMQAFKKYEYEGDFTFEVVRYLSKLPAEVMPEALKLLVKVGIHLISLMK